MNPDLLILALSFPSAFVVAFFLCKRRLARISQTISAHFDRLLNESTLQTQQRCEKLLQYIEGSKAVAEGALTQVDRPDTMRRALGEIKELLTKAISA